MGDFSFLVSPQTQDEMQRTAQAFQTAYSKHIEQQEAAARDQAAFARADLAAQSADKRAMEHTRMMYALQADRDKQAADRTEKQTSRQFTLSQVAQAKKNFYDLMSSTDKQINALATDTKNEFDPEWKSKYLPQLQAQRVTDTQSFENSIQDFLAHHKEGDTPQVDLTKMPSFQIQSALINPDIVAALQTKNANMRSQMSARLARMQALEAKTRGGAQLGSTEKKLQDNWHGAYAQYAKLYGDFQDIVKTLPPTDLRVEQARQDANKAATTFQAIDAEYGGAIRQGRFGQEMQHKLANGANIQGAEGSAALGASQPAPATPASTATGDNRVVTQPSTFDFSAPQDATQGQRNDNTDFNNSPDFVLPQSGMQNWFLNPGGVQ